MKYFESWNIHHHMVSSIESVRCEISLFKTGFVTPTRILLLSNLKFVMLAIKCVKMHAMLGSKQTSALETFNLHHQPPISWSIWAVEPCL